MNHCDKKYKENGRNVEVPGVRRRWAAVAGEGEGDGGVGGGERGGSGVIVI